MTLTLFDALSRLSAVRRTGRGWIARCPSHDDREPSLEIWLADGRPLFKCYAGCPVAAIRQAICGQTVRQMLSLSTGDAAPYGDAAMRSEWVRRIWNDSRLAVGTLATAYLQSRGITLAPPPSLRFHPNLKHPSGVYLPALVAAVQAVDCRVVAVHRTYLRPDGSRKANVEPVKMMLGPIRGGAVRLAPAGETLVLAEGIETALSVQQATGIPTGRRFDFRERFTEISG